MPDPSGFGDSPLSPTMLAALAPMLGTLVGGQFQSPTDAQNDQEMEALRQRAAQASQAANQAGQAYQSAAQAPAPQTSPWEDLATRLGGGVGAVLSGNNDLQRQSAQSLRDKQDQLMQARVQNLQALRDQYDQKSRAAEQLGNSELAGEMRIKSEQTMKALQAIFDQQHQGLIGARQQKLQAQKDAAAADRQKAKDAAAQTRKETPTPKAGGAAGTGDTSYMDSLMNTTRNGTKWLDTTNLPKSKDDARAALNYAKENGAIVVDKNTADRLRSADEVFRNLDEVEQQMASFLPKTPQERATKGPMNLLAQKTQTNPDIVAFGNTQLAAIRNVQALAAGMGSGFRLNEQEINRAIANFPKVTDTLPVAQKKIEWERNFLKNKEMAFRRQLGSSTPQPKQSDDPLGVR